MRISRAGKMPAYEARGNAIQHGILAEAAARAGELLHAKTA